MAKNLWRAKGPFSFFSLFALIVSLKHTQWWTEEEIRNFSLSDVQGFYSSGLTKLLFSVCFIFFLRLRLLTPIMSTTLRTAWRRVRGTGLKCLGKTACLQSLPVPVTRRWSVYSTYISCALISVCVCVCFCLLLRWQICLVKGQTNLFSSRFCLCVCDMTLQMICNCIDWCIIASLLCVCVCVRLNVFSLLFSYLLIFVGASELYLQAELVSNVIGRIFQHTHTHPALIYKTWIHEFTPPVAHKSLFFVCVNRSLTDG